MPTTMQSLFDNDSNKQERAEELRSLIRKYDYAYYVEAHPLVSDREYDSLFRELQDIEREHPELITLDSPTQRVSGEPLKEFPQVTHARPMLSLGNTYSREEVADFDRRARELLEGAAFDYVVELKYDGVAISLTYRDGVLVTGATRGDGVVGDDITQNIKTIGSIPLRVREVEVQGVALRNFEVRGEAYMLNDDFVKLNAEREEAGEKSYANPRNLTAGTLKQLDAREVAKRPLQMVCYYLYTDDLRLTHHSANIALLKDLGFPTGEITAVCSNLDEVFAVIGEYEHKREELPFMIDGIVLKIDSMRQQEELGTVARSPRWAIAYKYEAQKALTRLNSITLQVGRTGAVTPVAELQPVFLAGSTISRATLHNADYIQELDLRVGDMVIIEKGGEVIPKVSGVDTTQRSEDAQPYEFPHSCPCHLQTPLHRPEGEANYYCESPACPWQIRRRIEHFASRRAMDIEGLGEKVVELLVEKQFIHTIADIYDLHLRRDELQKLEGWGEKSVQKLLDGIEASKQQPYSRVLFALGIRFVGEGVAKILAKSFPSLELLQQASVEQLTAVNEIGGRIAQSVLDYCSDEHELALVRRMQAAGVQFEQEVVEQASSEFAGLTFVLTGELNTMTRTQAGELIEARGGKVSSSVSKKTSYVLAGAAAGSKLQKAIDLGVKVLSEEEFLGMVDNG